MSKLEIMSTQIRICLSDFWLGFDYNDNYFFQILSKKFNVVIDFNNPDFVIYSTYGTNFLKYKNAVRILYTPENVRPSYFECDYSIGFDYQTYGSKNLRYPLYVLYGFIPQLLEKKDAKKILNQKLYFCNMVVSNPYSKKRIDFFHLLNKLKRVDSGGKVLNNVGGPVENKLEFISKYRFTMAFENSSFPGYTTEKIFEPMKVNSIPIYWGSVRIGDEFNEKSFFNVHAYASLKDAAIAVVELENDHKKLELMLAEPWFHNNKISPYFSDERLCDFFEKIFFKERISKGSFNIFKRQSLAQFNVCRKKFKSAILRQSYCHTS